MSTVAPCGTPPRGHLNRRLSNGARRHRNPTVHHTSRISSWVLWAATLERGARVFGYHVRDPERYSVLVFDSEGRVLAIEEKPAQPKSSYAVVGMYFYDATAVEIARSLKPSSRGELEIADVNNAYLARGHLTVELLGSGLAWLDTGTHDSLVDATHYVKTIEDRQGLKVACVEEIAYRMGFIGAGDLARLAEPLKASGYGEYLLGLLDDSRASRG